MDDVDAGEDVGGAVTVEVGDDREAVRVIERIADGLRRLRRRRIAELAAAVVEQRGRRLIVVAKDGIDVAVAIDVDQLDRLRRLGVADIDGRERRELRRVGDGGSQP